MAESKRPRATRWWLLGTALVVALVVGGVAGGVIARATSGGGSNSGTSASSSTLSACPVTSVADHVVPSVVTIAANGANGSGTGSGEVIRSGGYILTNNHVISIAANGGSVHVLFADGHSAPATITGRDPQTDLAVLKVQETRNLKVISLGSSSSVKVGQPVVAIGAPLGLSGTVTAGIVSARDRTVQVPGEDDRSALLVSAVQTDASINPGNSGGALVNCEGRLVGVPTAGATVPDSGGGSIGLGFAIPVDLARSIADEIIATGKVSHAYFGLQAVPLPPGAAEQAGLPHGLFVRTVTPAGPAATAGLRAEDVITEIDGKPATSNVQLEELSLTKKAGDTVRIGYSRSGRSATATITLGRQP
ncbi:MAG TPA: trypsin-like peptidase domain-containing protein [Streptosporangiales bacterium]